jgi:hypothetical protein
VRGPLCDGAGQCGRGQAQEPGRCHDGIGCGRPATVSSELRVVPRTERPGRTNIRDGVAPDFNMVPFKDKLKDDEIWSVVNYIRSIKK